MFDPSLTGDDKSPMQPLPQPLPGTPSDVDRPIEPPAYEPRYEPFSNNPPQGPYRPFKDI